MTADLRAWVDLSRALGRDLLLTQASGGNTSVKLDDRRFWVKASGVRLGEATADNGGVMADYRKIRHGVVSMLRSPHVGSSSAETTDLDAGTAYQTLLASSALSKGPAVSLEAGLHALLPDRWVAHVHSVAGQLLGLMPENEAGEIVDRTMEGKVRWYKVPPAVPGHDLCRKAAEILSAEPSAATERGKVSLWILQNHGIAWGAPSDSLILSSSNAFESGLRAFFRLDRFPPPEIQPLTLPAPDGKTWYRVRLPKWPDRDFDATPILTDFVGHFDLWSGRAPDFVKTDHDAARILAASPREIEGHAQVFFAHALVSTLARREGWFRPLPPTVVQAIRNLGLEQSKPASPRYAP